MEELENQLAGAMEQLSAMREEVQNLQKSPLKSALQSSVHTLEEKASSLKEQISALKESILTGCRQALSEVREHGISALDNLARFFHLRQSFEEIRDTIQEAVQTDTRTIEKIEAMAAQYHEAGKHLKNACRKGGSNRGKAHRKGCKNHCRTVPGRSGLSGGHDRNR